MAELHYSLVQKDEQWCAMVDGGLPRCFEDRDLAFSKISSLVAKAIACGHAADLTVEETPSRREPGPLPLT